MDKMNNTNSDELEPISDDSFREYVIESVTLISEGGDKSREVLSELASDHWEYITSPVTDESEITDILGDLLDKGPLHLRSAVAAAHGYIAPNNFLKRLSEKIVSENLYGNSELSEYETGVYNATIELQGVYYGSMCPGLLSSLREEPEALKEAYNNLLEIAEPIIKAYPTSQAAEWLTEILDDLSSNLSENS
jgi:hypothetical protein